MKFNVKLVLFFAALLVMSCLLSSVLLIRQTYQNPKTIEKINDQVAVNLGSLNSLVTDKERDVLFQLYIYQLPLQERRLEENHLYPGPGETFWSKLINNKLTALTKQYLHAPEVASDLIGYDPFHNYEIKALRKLKDYLSEEDYQEVIMLYSADRTHNPSAREKLLAIFNEYEMLNQEKTVNYLIDYKPMTHNATYELDEALNLSNKSVLKPNLSWIDTKTQLFYNEIFQEVKQLLPPEYINDLDSVTFLVDREDAKVIKSDPSQVALILDPIDYEMLTDLRPFYESILHQYFHYVTLANGQVDKTNNYDMSVYCERNLVTKPLSYLNLFYQRFWTTTYQDRLINELSFEFYIRHKEDFVSPYASTNPVEDLAESFAHFVLNDKPSDTSVANQKLLYFYEFEEWVAFRNDFRRLIQM